MKQHEPQAGEKAGKLGQWLWAVAAVFLTCFYPCAFEWLVNADEATAGDFLPMLAVFLLMALAAFFIAGLVMKSPARGGLFTALFMVGSTNLGLLSGFLKEHISWFRDRYLLLAFGLIVIGLGVLLFRHKRFPAKECCMILSIVFIVLLGASFVRAAPTLYEILSAQRRESGVDGAEIQLENDQKNVYYFILDEYGGKENLERYYDYDNSGFLNALEEKGFNVSYTSKNTESLYTWALVPNLLNLDYVVDDSLPHLVKKEYVDNPEIVKLFRANGYQVNMIDHRDFLGHTNCNVRTERQLGETISVYIYDNSILNLLPGVRYKLKLLLGLTSDNYYTDEILKVFDLMRHCAEDTDGKPTFTLCYMQCPHQPFIFEADGTPRYTGTSDLYHKYYYLDQLIYFNTILEETVDNIIARDPEAVIILQSDHGARYPAQMYVGFGEPPLDQSVENPYMQNILNCVYVGGEPLEIEGLTGINTLRTVLNSQFGTKLPMLETPSGYISDLTSWK